jgi:hypothetical protein
MVSDGTMASGADRSHDDALRVTRAGGVRRDVWALVVVAVGIGVGLFVLRSGTPPSVARVPETPSVASSAPHAANGPATAPSREEGTTMPSTIPRSRGAKLRALRALGVTPERGPDGKRHLDAAPVIDALNRAGVHDGIAAFPPPGTDPPKAGVIVPDGVELPEGYVRHYQTTDDGQPLPPILMFHPDYTFTDELGNPVAVPPDRVVPPELVPPGMPVQMLAIPARDGAR